jgi:tol-pal system protein YbgF
MLSGIAGGIVRQQLSACRGYPGRVMRVNWPKQCAIHRKGKGKRASEFAPSSPPFLTGELPPLKSSWMQIRICVLMGVCSLLAGPVGCATSTQVELELSRLRREVREARTETRNLRKTVERLDGQMAMVRAKGKEPHENRASSRANQKLKATASQPIVRKLPELPVVRLNAGAVEEIGAPIMIKIGPSNTLPVDRSVLKKKDPVLSRASKKKSTGPSVDETTQQYELALAMLRENRQPQRAREMFKKFRARNSDSQLSVNVAYWLAECSFVSGEQALAIDEFLGVAEAFPRSMKAADALLRVAQIWQQRGNAKKALEVYTKIGEKYPNSDAAAMAQAAIASHQKKVQK